MQKDFMLEKTFDVTTTIKIVKRNGRYYAEVDRNFDDLWEENDEYECWIDEPDNLMTEENPTEQEYDAIIETFRDYIIANGQKFLRKCDKCGCGMNEGYVVYNGEEHYCTEECLNKVYTKEQWTEMYEESEENGGSDNYWTEWYQDIEEDDFNFVLFDNKLIQM
jgi:hypothetical protein